MTDVELLLLHSHTWNYLTMSKKKKKKRKKEKKKSSGFFKSVINKMFLQMNIFIIYMYEQNLTLNNLRGLICYKIQLTNQLTNQLCAPGFLSVFIWVCIFQMINNNRIYELAFYKKIKISTIKTQKKMAASYFASFNLYFLSIHPRILKINPDQITKAKHILITLTKFESSSQSKISCTQPKTEQNNR